MSLLSRWANIFRGDRVNREIDEELQAHIEQAIEEGRDPEEARRALGSVVRHRDYCRDARIITWLDSLRADAIFGTRQLRKRKLISATAILSLGLGIGACVSAFRLIDALLLRPLPITEPGRLYVLSREEMGFDGKFGTFDGWAYPAFSLMRTAVKDRADLIAVSYAERTDLTYGSDLEIEKAYLQYVSGSMFNLFGIQPALGRLLVESDDLEPGSHPYTVLSHAYWTARFQQDPKVIGRVFRLGNQLYEIIGVAEPPFTGTEPGVMVDIFVPAMMHQSVTRADNTWHRTLALLKPGVAVEPLRLKLDAISLAFERERARGFANMSKLSIENYLRQRVMLEPAPSGVSDVQGGNRRSLLILGLIVALVLLIACANVANLMTAQAAARAREMGLRVSIGAGRLRLVQLLIVECGILASLAAAVGAVFAWWAAPFVVRMINPADNPVRLDLPGDLRVLAFGSGFDGPGHTPLRPDSRVARLRHPPGHSAQGRRKRTFAPSHNARLGRYSSNILFCRAFPLGSFCSLFRAPFTSTNRLLCRSALDSRYDREAASAGGLLESGGRTLGLGARCRAGCARWMAASERLGLEQLYRRQRLPSHRRSDLLPACLAKLGSHHEDSDAERPRFSLERYISRKRDCE